MYRILSDNLIIYDPRMPEYTVYDSQCDIGVNEAGQLRFTMPESHPHYGQINLMKSIVTLWDDNRLVFRGRPFAPTVDLFKENVIDCEGELAFFNDTYQEPFSFFGTPADLFTQTINFHNSQVSEEKQFKVGNITVTSGTQEGNITRSSMDYMNTWEFLHDKFIDSALGGYLWLRHEADGTYIDYLADLPYYSNQGVTQCINLIDGLKMVTSEDLATVVIPLGQQLTNEDGELLPEWTTIASVNDDKIYLQDDEAVAIYGRITKTVHHDDIADPSNLLLAGRKDLAKALGVATTYELTASDMSKAGYNVNPFILGHYVQVRVPNLDVDAMMLISHMTIFPQAIGEEMLVIGDTIKTLTQSQLNTVKTIEETTNNLTIGVAQAESSIIRTQREIESTINQTAEEIYSNVAENYYNAEQTDELLQSMSTTITQTASDILFEFNQFVNEQAGVNSDVAGEFQNISRYIRFENGNIILGEAGNEMTLRIENDRITFLENGAGIAYWQNRKFYAVDGEFINSLRLGKFAFIPRPNGNLSFKKVID